MTALQQSASIFFPREAEPLPLIERGQAEEHRLRITNFDDSDENEEPVSKYVTAEG